MLAQVVAARLCGDAVGGDPQRPDQRAAALRDGLRSRLRRSLREPRPRRAAAHAGAARGVPARGDDRVDGAGAGVHERTGGGRGRHRRVRGRCRLRLLRLVDRRVAHRLALLRAEPARRQRDVDQLVDAARGPALRAAQAGRPRLHVARHVRGDLRRRHGAAADLCDRHSAAWGRAATACSAPRSRPARCSSSLVLVALPPVRRAGRALLVAVAVYGLATIGFGLSRWFPLSLVCVHAGRDGRSGERGDAQHRRSSWPRRTRCAAGSAR